MANQVQDTLDPEQLIRELRAARGVDDVEGHHTINIEDLEASVKLLFSNLSNKATNFLLEIIKNADENVYDRSVVPALQFTLCHHVDPNCAGYLWISCNEMGFRAEDVDAICRINKSTKVKEAQTGGSVPSRGVGFKSVFKIADVVWISSGPFQFKLDRRERLGIITPTRSSLPYNPPIQGNTVFCLQIPSETDFEDVKSQLKSVQPMLLLFLKQLVAIKISIRDANIDIPRVLSKSISRTRQPRQVEIVQLQDNTLTYRYYSITGHIPEMPKEEKRGGYSESEMMLAFPINQINNLDNTWSQNLYSFFPIRRSGFPFVIHSDFILTDSQAGIKPCPWNTRLQRGIAEVFLAAVTEFNQDNSLWHQWPKMLSTTPDLYLPDVYSLILQGLCAAKVLKSRADFMAIPCKLMFTPAEFRDADGNPFLDREEDRRSSLALDYDIRMLNRLNLGVREMQPCDDFLATFEDFSNRDSTIMQAKSLGWHEALATTLTQFDPLRLKNLKIIPLDDGSWVDSTHQGLCFPAVGNRVEIPHGIKVNIIATETHDSISRRELYERLGVRPLDEARICQLILEQHKTWTYPQGSMEMIASHAAYIFRSSYDMQPSDILWLFDENGGVHRNGSGLYLDLKDMKRPVRSYFVEDPSQIQLLHPLYLQQVQGEESSAKWVRWLQCSLMVSDIPRLTDSTGDISSEFKYLIDTEPSEIFLTLLRDHWDDYIHPFERNQQVISKLCEILSEQIVQCKSGKKTLKNTALPVPHLLEATGADQVLEFIDVPEPTNPRWKILSHMGVFTKDDFSFNLHLLQNLSERNFTNISLNNIVAIYNSLASKCDSTEDRNIARSAFASEKLIFWPSIGCPLNNSRWLSLADCVWRFPLCFRSRTTLYPVYESYEGIHKFFAKLGLKETPTVGDVVVELKYFSQGWMDRSIAKALLQELNGCLSSEKDSSELHTIKDLMVIPVLVRQGDSEQIQFLNCIQSGWFIADTTRLRKCFEQRVPLLDFEPAELESISLVLEQLDLSKLKLSTLVEQKHLIRGQPILNLDLTIKLKEKTAYLLDLLAPPTRGEYEDKFQNLAVFHVPRIDVQLTVYCGGESYHGQQVGRTSIENSSNSIQIFVAETSNRRIETLMELSEQFAQLFGGLTQEKERMLQKIILFSEVTDIENMIESEKIRPPPTCIDAGKENKKIDEGNKREAEVKDRVISLRLSVYQSNEQDADSLRPEASLLQPMDENVEPIPQINIAAKTRASSEWRRRVRSSFGGKGGTGRPNASLLRRRSLSALARVPEEKFIDYKDPQSGVRRQQPSSVGPFIP